MCRIYVGYIIYITFKFISSTSAPVGLEDVSKYPELFSTLLASGMWTIEDLKKLAGLNFLRVFREVERVNIFTLKIRWNLRMKSKNFSEYILSTYLQIIGFSNAAGGVGT